MERVVFDNRLYSYLFQAIIFDNLYFYDWLDSVNLYLNESEHKNDSIAVQKYSVVQSQIHYDLGDYDKSLAILIFLLCILKRN